jgi:hypothetical protein
MTRICFQWMPGLSALALLFLAGCGETAKSPPPLPIDQVPQVLESAFKNAPAEAGAAASEAISAVREDASGALDELQELSIRPDLSDEQRMAASRAMAAYLQKLRETAEKGDKKAEDALQQYRATK